MLSHFHPPKAQLDLELDRAAFSPGDRIGVRISLSSEEDFFVRQGRLDLVCAEVHYYASEASYTKSVNELGRWSEPIFEKSQILSGVPFHEDVSFQLRSSAWPTNKGEIVDISWQLQASLDEVGGRDIHIVQSIVVVSYPLHSVLSGEPESRFDQCLMFLHLSPIYVRHGSMLEGSLRVKPSQDFIVPAVRAELECTERAGDRQRKYTGDRIVLQSYASLLANGDSQWPFQLQAPESGPTSGSAENTSVVWRVRGVLDRRRSRDLLVERQIQVHTAP